LKSTTPILRRSSWSSVSLICVSFLDPLPAVMLMLGCLVVVGSHGLIGSSIGLQHHRVLRGLLVWWRALRGPQYPLPGLSILLLSLFQRLLLYLGLSLISCRSSRPWPLHDGNLGLLCPVLEPGVLSIQEMMERGWRVVQGRWGPSEQQGEGWRGLGEDCGRRPHHQPVQGGLQLARVQHGLPIIPRLGGARGREAGVAKPWTVVLRHPARFWESFEVLTKA